MKYTLTFYLADKKVNAFMKKVDLCPPGKVYLTDMHIVDIETETIVDKNYIHNLINKSKEDKDYWIPVIVYNDIMYIDEGITIISNGEKEAFVNKETKP